MDEPPSPLLKSRIPRKTIIIDPSDGFLENLHCPLRKGIFYYTQWNVIFEYNIYSSGKHEPRIIVPNHLSWLLIEFSFVPIKGNHTLLFAKYIENLVHFLHLSIHEIRSDSRVGPALWSFNSRVPDHWNDSHLELIKSTKNPLAITFMVWFNDHWRLFDISTATETEASNKFRLKVESGRIDVDLKIKGLKWAHDDNLVKLSPDKRILLNVDLETERDNETIDIHYSESGGTNFSFVTRMSIPIPWASEASDFGLQKPKFVFSADGSKCAFAMNFGRVSVWDIRSKEIFIALHYNHHIRYLQFSSGKLGREVLVFAVRDFSSLLDTIHVIDATSFETEEKISFKVKRLSEAGLYMGVDSLFFDPSGVTLYAAVDGTLHEWDLRKNRFGSEWWIGEE